MRFALFCKSFGDDVERFATLVDSVERYNRSGLPLIASVPRGDLPLFRDRIGTGRVDFLTDEDILGRRVEQSWVTQQLVKLEAYRTGFADAWYWFDSDAYFFRDFTVADFVRDDGSVAMVASRVKHILDDEWDTLVRFLDDPAVVPPLTPAELCVYGAAPFRSITWRSRLVDTLRPPDQRAGMPRTRLFFDRHGPAFEALPGAIWTSDSLRSLYREVLDPHGLTFARLLRHAPWEASWIAEWELYRGLPSRHLIHPLMVHIRLDATILRARQERITTDRLARRYLGIHLAARHQSLTSLDP